METDSLIEFMILSFPTVVSAGENRALQKLKNEDIKDNYNGLKLRNFGFGSVQAGFDVV